MNESGHDNGSSGDSDPPKHRRRLAPVPEATTPGDRTPVVSWILTLSEPLLSMNRRIMAEQKMASFVDHNSPWVAVWLAGFLHDIAATLPPEDPWLHMSATVNLNDISALPGPAAGTHPPQIKAALGTAPVQPPEDGPPTRLEYTTGPNPPGATGALKPDGGTFGSYRDATDLVMSELGRPENDEKLTAVAEGLDPLPAAIVAFAPGPIEETADLLSGIFHHMWLAEFAGTGPAEASAGERFLDVTGQALRWLVHRRRAYTGNDDPYPTIAGHAWIPRADRVIGNGQTIEAQGSLARQARIDPGTYGVLRSHED